MRIVVLIARLLMGLAFLVLGLNGFLHFIPTGSPPPGLAGTYYGVLIASNYYILTFGVQVVAGILLLANQYVRLALVLLGAELVNILTFHITMMPSGLPLALIMTVLWLIVAYDHRAFFSEVFARTSSRADSV
ncbi:MAG: hypothetical protein M3Y21_05495 [Candidatus Eremiobacteraeota bacterium]|nr:hypothetical protein [Candidatus Eremiobacteraeota bacterium]